MDNKVDNHTLLEFAEQRLQEHVAELNTQYEGRSMPSDDEKEQAFETHFKMFNAELEEKSKELGNEEDNKSSLEEYKEKFKKALAHL